MSFLKGTLHGNLGRDPESFEYGNDKKTGVRLSVAIKDGYGEDAKTQWVKATCFGKKGEVIAKHFVKGDGIILTGNVKLDTFTDKEGKERTALALMVDDFDFVGGKKAANGDGGASTGNSGGGNGGSRSSSSNSGGSRSSSGGSRSAAPARGNSATAIEDDDVPF